MPFCLPVPDGLKQLIRVLGRFRFFFRGRLRGPGILILGFWLLVFFLILFWVLGLGFGLGWFKNGQGS